MSLPDLRDYQSQAIESLRVGVAEGHKRQVLVAPTGAGKSVIAHAIVARALLRNRRVLFAVNRVQLVQQFSERLLEAGIEHGILRGEDSRREYLPVIVGSIQTIARRGLPDSFDLIIIDEAHAVPGSKDYLKVLRDNRGATVLGLTATPWARGMSRHDAEIGGPIFSNAVVAAHYSELIRAGHLVDCDCYAPSEPDMKGVRTQRNQFGEIDYVESDLGAVCNQPKLIGDIVQHWKRLANGTPTVVFAHSTAHSRAIVEQFQRAGVRAEHIDAYCEHAERVLMLSRVDCGDSVMISCAALLAEGWDQPKIRTLILARPTKSMTRFIQMAGRILRPFPGKDRALLLDHSGTVLRLGFPTQDREYQLDDGKPPKSVVAQKEKERLPSKCTSCGFVDPHRKNPCERCGHKRVVKKHIAHSHGALEKLEKPAAASRDDKQAFYSQLLSWQRASGYAAGWVSHKYRTKFGVWPRGMLDVEVEPSNAMKAWITSQNIRYAKRPGTGK